MDDKKVFYTGMVLTVGSAMLWGLSGTAAQFVQHDRAMSAEWLVTFRLFVAGILTLLLAYMRQGRKIFAIFSDSRDVVKLVIFGLFGVAMCQYTYFRCIYYAGSGIASVLQYLAPAFIIIFFAVVYRRWPTWRDLISVALAIGGTMVIAFQGHFDIHALEYRVLFWGILSAIALTIYTVQPVSLLQRYDTMSVLGFAMLIGGVATFILWRPTHIVGQWDMMTVASLFAIIVLGTVVSFAAFLEGLKRVGAVKSSILSSVEPIAAAVIGWALLGNTFTLSDAIGFVMILTTIFILAGGKRKNNSVNQG